MCQAISENIPEKGIHLPSRFARMPSFSYCFTLQLSTPGSIREEHDRPFLLTTVLAHHKHTARESKEEQHIGLPTRVERCCQKVILNVKLMRAIYIGSANCPKWLIAKCSGHRILSPLFLTYPIIREDREREIGRLLATQKCWTRSGVLTG